MADEVLDLTILKLRKKQEAERKAGNLVAEHALDLLIKGYEQGIWAVYWDKGEPLFAMPTEAPEDVLASMVEKD